jgi:transcriptional regulator with XRE-family HTH domain
VSGGGDFAYALPRLLGLHNLSGARFAALLGVSAQYVSLLMNGERRPTSERLAQIAQIFGISPERLASAPFEDLLRVDLADPVRFRETEERIEALRRAREGKPAP